MKVIEVLNNTKYLRFGYYAQDSDCQINRFKSKPTLRNGVWTDELHPEIKKHITIAHLCDDWDTAIVFGDSYALEVQQAPAF